MQRWLPSNDAVSDFLSRARCSQKLGKDEHIWNDMDHSTLPQQRQNGGSKAHAAGATTSSPQATVRSFLFDMVKENINTNL